MAGAYADIDSNTLYDGYRKLTSALLLTLAAPGGSMGSLTMEIVCRIFNSEYGLYARTSRASIVTGVASPNQTPRSLVMGVVHERTGYHFTCKVSFLYTWHIARSAFAEFALHHALSQFVLRTAPHQYMHELVVDKGSRPLSFSTNANFPVLLDYTVMSADTPRRSSDNLLERLVKMNTLTNAQKDAMHEKSTWTNSRGASNVLPAMAMVMESCDFALQARAKEVYTARRQDIPAWFEGMTVQALSVFHALSSDSLHTVHHDVHPENLFTSARVPVTPTTAPRNQPAFFYRIEREQRTTPAVAAAAAAAAVATPVEYVRVPPFVSRDASASELPTLKLIDFGMASYQFVDRDHRMFTSPSNADVPVFREHAVNYRLIDAHVPAHDVLRLAFSLLYILANIHDHAQRWDPLEAAAEIVCRLLPRTIMQKLTNERDVEVIKPHTFQAYGRLLGYINGNRWQECLKFMSRQDVLQALLFGAVDIAAHANNAAEFTPLNVLRRSFGPYITTAAPTEHDVVQFDMQIK
jgi:hypothetical protein